MPEVSEQDRAQTERVLARLKHAADATNDLRSEWMDNFKTYLARREDPNYPWESNLVMPAVFDAVETHLPHVVAEDVELRAVPREGADPGRARVIDAILAYWSQRMDLGWKLVPMMKQNLIYGTTPYFLGYVSEKRTQRVRTFERARFGPGDEILIPSEEEREVTSFEGAWMRAPDIFSVYWQPGKNMVNAPNGQGMDWLIEHFLVSFKYLEKLNSQGVLKRGALARLRETSQPISSEQRLDAEERHRVLGVDISRPDDTMEMVEILAMFGDRGHGPDGLVWLGNREVILRDEPNPFFHGEIPYGFITDVPLPHSLTGLGEATILKQYQDQKSDLRNARLDNVHLIVNRMWKRIRGSGIDPNQLVSRPGGVIDVGSMSDLEPAVQQEVPLSTYQDEELLQSDIERTAGQLDVLRGNRIGGDRSSATENQLLAEFAAARTRIKLMSMKRGLRQIGRWMIKLAQQFTTEETVIRLVGPTGATDIKVLPEDLVGEWDVVPVIDQKLPLTKVQRRTEVNELLQVMAPFMGQFVNPDPLLEEAFKAYGFPDVERFLVSHQQAAAAQANPQEIARRALDEAAARDESLFQGEGAPIQ